MPYIKKHFEFTNYNGTMVAQTVPNMDGNNMSIYHKASLSTDLHTAMDTLLDEANIAYTKVNAYTYNIWGVEFTVLAGCYRMATDQTDNISVLPYGNCHIPNRNNNYGTNSGNAGNRIYYANNIMNEYCLMYNTADANKVDFRLYLYYNENCIYFKVCETNNVGGYAMPLFYLMKGTTIDNHNVAILGGTPSGQHQTAWGTQNNYYGWRHELFDLDDIPHTLGVAYRTEAECITPFRQFNVGQFGNDYLVDDICLEPISNDCYRGYVKIPNVYYIDQFIVNREQLWDRVIEINGQQYYIPQYQVSTGNGTYTGAAVQHPVAIKL